MGNSSTSSSKKRFAVKLVIFLLLVVALDAGVGGVLRVFYFRQNSGLNFRTTYALDHSMEDLVILGSSRAQANYVPSIIEDVLETSCYNAGRDGQSLLYSHAVQQAVMARHKPDILILDLILSDFFEYGPHYDKLSALLPYYKAHEEIQSVVQLRSDFERIKVLSQIYPFNSLPLQIVKYNLSKSHEQDGHVPLFGELDLSKASKDNKPVAWASGELDPNKVQALVHLADSCAKDGVKLIVSVSPVFGGTILGRDATDKVAEVLKVNSWELWDYSAHPDLVNNPTLFRDKGHLNQTGARRYTEIIAKRIKAGTGSDS